MVASVPVGPTAQSASSSLNSPTREAVPFRERLTCTINQAAEAIGRSRDTIHRLIAAGRLETVRLDPASQQLVRVPSLRRLVGELLPPAPESEDVETLKVLLKNCLEVASGGEHPERMTAALQLRVLRGFLGRCGVPENLMQPLGKLLGALVDAERGAANPMLRPRHRAEGGRPPPLFHRDRHRVTAAAVIDLLIRAGATERKASGYVVRSLKAAGIDLSSSSSALMAFRDRLATGEADGAAFYRSEIARTDALAPADGANWLLTGLIAALSEKTS